MTIGEGSDTHWPGSDERVVVEEMLRDRASKHWEMCGRFVKRRVSVKAKNISSNLQEEISQEVMFKIMKYLSNFNFHCALKTWLNLVIDHSITDGYRRLRYEEQWIVPLSNPLLSERDPTEEAFTLSDAKSVEDICETNEKLRNAYAALLEYTTLHSNPIRDRLIIGKVIFEGYSHTEAAKMVGCSPAIVGYVVRQAQHYTREKMGFKL